MAVFRLSGFRAVRITSYWTARADGAERRRATVLRTSRDAALRNGVSVYVTVMSPGSATTPLTDDARADFAVVRRGDRPRRAVARAHHRRQRAEPQPLLAPAVRRSTARAPRPPAYLALLAQTYDASRRRRRDVQRLRRRRLAARHATAPTAFGPTHSPTTFIQGLGAAYRASGRNRPVMDALAIHPYADNSSQRTDDRSSAQHDDHVADYDKLVALLGEAFDGTASPDRTLPILYGEFGVESRDPGGEGVPVHGHRADDHEARERVDAGRLLPSRRSRSRSASRTSRGCCSSSRATSAPAAPGSPGSTTSTARRRRASARVTRSLDRTTGGSVTRCPGLELPVRTSYLRFGTRSAAKRGVFRSSFRCDLDCRYFVRLENAVTHATKLAASGSAEVGELVQAELGTRRLKPGTYRYTLRLVHPVNPAAPTVRAGPRFSLP